MNFFQILSCSGDLGNCCSDLGIVVTLNLFQNIMNLIQVLVPIILMVCASLEFIKLSIDPNRKGGISRIRNMFIAAAVVFFVPMI